MPPQKRITDLTDYTSILPYASELFGVYQPMIGWRSAIKQSRFKDGLADSQQGLLQALVSTYVGETRTDFSLTDCALTVDKIGIGRLAGPRLISNDNSVLMQALASTLPDTRPPAGEEWEGRINEDILSNILNTTVIEHYSADYQSQCRDLHAEAARQNNVVRSVYLAPSVGLDLSARLEVVIRVQRQRIAYESALAGALLGLVRKKQFAHLETLFYMQPLADSHLVSSDISRLLDEVDPLATFDPKKDITNVSLSPLGIVHLFREYFFELDTFLGTPTGHVWLSPGSLVELIEVSTRRVYVEKTVEQSLQTTKKSELSTTENDEISEAVKTDNKSDLKLGASLTVNQSWGTGNATATGSLNMDQTQDTARENTHKRMREQTVKLSSEIKENFKSTFKTVTETTDTSSKRYVLNNTSHKLVNYELRRKMRQIGVQVQDVGTYLCWETFVDEPGRALGLANLVNIAKPADLHAAPDQTQVQMPPDKDVPFTANVVWNFDNHRRFNGPDGFLPLTTVPVPPAPEGYEVKYPDSIIDAFQVSGSGEDFSGAWAFKAKLQGSANVSVGPYIGPGGMKWDETINFVVGGVIRFTPDATKRKSIDDANAAKIAAGKAATEAEARATRAAFVTAAQARVEAAGAITSRKYEDLREEERIIVYRNLIGMLMSRALYGLPENPNNNQTRHVMSELINSIFDIDKMLYFVAPEWWKPRKHYHQYVGAGSNEATFAESVTSWSDQEARDDNYYITEKSKPARLGSSLGWLLQLDGDDLRNAFLNAPWVKAVIPIRPGKELEASNWLQQMRVEGTDGLGDLYQAPANELDTIKAQLGIADVTIADAIRYLCAQVAAKYAESLKVGEFPKDEINDDNKVSATPIDKVYEHGFYPLKGGFRATTSEPYEVFDQWVEVLPTDQVVPVEVTYDPRTGRQILPPDK
jgi:hypothetical protein